MSAGTVCPTCGGLPWDGVALVHGRLVETKCPTCKGAASITPEHFQRVLLGRKMREEREASGEPLRVAARRQGMSATTLSRLERGEVPA